MRPASQSACERLVALLDGNRLARQLDAERRAATLLASNRDPAAVRLDDPLRDRETQAGSRDACGAGARGPEEGGEHVREIALRDADAGVGHLELRGDVVAVDAQLDPAA